MTLPSTDRLPEAAARRILVTGVGGAPGLDLARCLTSLGCHVIATDAHPLAPGLLLAGVTPRVLPAAGHPAFAEELLRACRDLRPDGLVSCVEQELPHLSALRTELARLGVRTWLPGPRSIDTCLDKAAFARSLRAHGIPAPRTWLPGALDKVPDGVPLVVKPRRGHGSQGVNFCATRRQAAVLCELLEDPLIQERVSGREFTADCLVDRNGRPSVVLRLRHLVKGGLAVVSETFRDEQAAQVVTATLAAVGAAGPCCVQGFWRESGARQVMITELNARVAGGFLCSQAAGADLVGQLLRGLYGEVVDHDRLRYTPGVFLTKYAETLATGPAPGLATNAATGAATQGRPEGARGRARTRARPPRRRASAGTPAPTCTGEKPLPWPRSSPVVTGATPRSPNALSAPLLISSASPTPWRSPPAPRPCTWRCWLPISVRETR